MTDNKLSTRDLANRSDTEDSSLDTERPAANVAREGEPQYESAPSDEPLARERTEDDPETTETAAAGDDREPLLPADQSERFTARWQEIQASFVDQPRDAVAEADALVADLMQRLAASFSHERERLEGHWDRGDDVSTEDLRVALTRYRSFFDRLLSA